MTTFTRTDLLETLNQCRPALAAVGLVPELSHLWFDGKNVYAYDGGLGIRRKLECELDCGLPGRVLLDILKTSSLKQVSVEQTDEGVVVQMGKAKVKLASLPSERRVWPFPKVLPKKGGLKLNEAMFKAFGELGFVKQSRGTMAVHHGVTMHVEHDTTGMYSTDSKTIAHRVIKAQSVSMPLFIVPWGMVSAITALLPEKKDPRLWCMDDCLIAGAPGTMLCSNLLEQGSTNLPKIMKEKFGGKLRALPKGLRPLLERVVILAGTEDPMVSVSASKGVLRLRGKWPMGTMDEKIDIDGPIENLINVKLRADHIVRAIDASDRFRLERAALMMAGGDDFRYLVGTKDG